MILSSDPLGVIHDTAAQVVSVVNTFIPDLSVQARDSINTAIIAYCGDDPSRVDDALMFSRTVHMKVSAGEKFNPVTALMYGMAPPSTAADANLLAFLSTLDGDSIIDVRTKTEDKTASLTLNIGSTLSSDDLEAFTADKRDAAVGLIHGMAHMVAEDAGVEGMFLLGMGSSDPLGVPSTAIMVASGMLPALVRLSIEMDGMSGMPAELLITLYRDDLIEALPDVGVYREYRDKMRENADTST